MVKSTRKKQMPKSLRLIIWNKWIGDSVAKTQCPSCRVNIITIFNFDCGHICSRANGGDDSIQNIIPMCRTCNLSMGKNNAKLFIQKYHKINVLSILKKKQIERVIYDKIFDFFKKVRRIKHIKILLRIIASQSKSS